MEAGVDAEHLEFAVVVGGGVEALVAATQLPGADLKTLFIDEWDIGYSDHSRTTDSRSYCSVGSAPKYPYR